MASRTTQNMGPDLHHMATFILRLKMWHLRQNSLSVLTQNTPLKKYSFFIHLKSEMYTFQRPTILNYQ